MKYVENIKPSHTVGLQISIVKICCLYHLSQGDLTFITLMLETKKATKNKNMHHPKMNIGISLSRLPSGPDFFVRLHY